MFERFGDQLKRVSSLYVSVFCEDYTEEGLIAGYPVVQLPKVDEHLTGVFADNKRILQLANEKFAMTAPTYVHYQPTEMTRTRDEPNDSRPQATLEILWAGRLDRQKRPDLLVEIARKCIALPVRFTVYGDSLLDSFDWKSQLEALKNVQYLGGFNGIESIPLNSFNLLFCTSQWEGLPNLLLEASAAALPVISSNVGGIEELVAPGKTGFLVTPFDDIDAYVAAIEWSIENRQGVQEMGARAAEMIAERHSWSGFKGAVCSVPGYLVGENSEVIAVSETDSW